MTIFIWVVLAFLFIKCVGWVLAPFQRDEPDNIEENYYTSIHITDSYNTDNSIFKGGTYHGAKKEDTNQTDNDYFSGTYRRHL